MTQPEAVSVLGGVRVEKKQLANVFWQGDGEVVQFVDVCRSINKDIFNLSA